MAPSCSRPAAISCPGRCDAVLDDGLEVTLVADPDARSTFVGWEGSCTGSHICRLTLGAPATVRAVFARARETFTVRVSGRGRVTSRPAGIRCPGRCKLTLDRDATVRLTPVRDRGYRFALERRLHRLAGLFSDSDGGSHRPRGVVAVDAAVAAHSREAFR